MRVCIVSKTSKVDRLTPVSNYKYVGGGGISTHTLALALEGLGHEVLIAGHPDEIGKGFDVVLHQNTKLLPETQRKAEELGLPFAVTVNGMISCPKATHVKSRDYFGYECRKCSLPGLLHCFATDKDMGYSWFRADENNRAALLLTALPRYQLLRARMQALAKAGQVIPIDQILRSTLVEAGVPAERIDVCPQPVSEDFLRDSGERVFAEKTFVFSGGTQWIKGFEASVWAVERVPKARLAVLGHQVPERVQWAKKVLGNRVTFPGNIDNREIGKYFYSAYGALFSSVWFEGYARAFSEPMMCGTPVIAFPDRGGGDYMEHERTALVARERSVEAYAEQIKRLVEDEGLRNRLGRNAREYAVENFSADKVAGRYEKMLKAVARQGSGKKCR
ncbi:MAG TPA: glycosyltransferase family 4 protein [Candidatus Diapherotrites archaeon]|uniref:Glycosyltransferase family 4 protein n=1 Tax=Candidatus Iainarchaeum sp. TaxID=3101447 RepID=A0A7J4JH76_9ARCH|nr:glycosyltransferase family 4 protein [Candidatus Diapherotrites archaeon]